MTLTLDHLRRYAVARSLFKPTTLSRAIQRLGFVQADPIRAPARAQDLTLRHRVAGYRAGDLERRYPRLPLEEDFFVNYGFLPREHHQLMHPRTAREAWTPARWKQAIPNTAQRFIWSPRAWMRALSFCKRASLCWRMTPPKPCNSVSTRSSTSSIRALCA